MIEICAREMKSIVEGAQDVCLSIQHALPEKIEKFCFGKLFKCKTNLRIT